MQKNYFGVITKRHDGYILFTHKSEINMSEELKHFWKLDVPVHITIESETRKMLNEDKCEIYYDKDADKKYKLHINDINLEQILEGSIGKQLDITIRWNNVDTNGGSEHGAKSIHKS